MKKYFCLLLLLFESFNYAKGQPYHKLKPGEKVPDVTFTVLKNGKFHTRKISDYTGKLLILDYWHKWCGSCLAAFPRLTEIQKKYNGRIVILPISFLHTPKVVADFVGGRKGTDGEINLPLAIMPSTDNPLFKSLPTVGYPYDVWIDEQGNFITASDASDITEKSLNAALQKKDVGFQKRSDQMNFNPQKPFLINNNGGPDSAFLFRSLISKGIDSVSQFYDLSFTKDHCHIFYGLKTVAELIKYSLKEGISDDAYNKYFVFDSTIKERLAPDSIFHTKDWIRHNRFCYDLSLPPGFDRGEAFALMHQDIDKFFKVNSHFEKREMDCIVLTTDGNLKLPKSTESAFNKILNGRLVLKNRPPETLLSFITDAYCPILIDETIYGYGIDLNVSVSKKFDINFYNKQLAGYGLKLVSAKRELNVIAVYGTK